MFYFYKAEKGGFVIDTPYGNYSPDWAVVCRKEALKDPSIGIYFIVETKAGKTWADLTDVERIRFIAENFILKQYPMIRSLTG